MIEALRNRMMDETGDTSYRDSNIIEITIWKRDLLNESAVYKPQRYVFDTSKFIITGRAEGTSWQPSYIDAAISAPDPQDFNEIMSKIVVRKYGPGGNSGTYIGNIISEGKYFSEDLGVDSRIMFENHVIDYYIKTFMKLTTGFDLNEDVFPFLEGNVLFDGPDPGNEIIYQEMVEKARTLFVDLDVESSLNYDRLKGEISRSIFMSSQKYRNRIIYPKIFERVFCILIDPDSFTLANRDSELRKFLESGASDSIYGNGGVYAVLCNYILKAR